MTPIRNYRDAKPWVPQVDNTSECVTCGTIMKMCWNTVCSVCGDTSCYEHSTLVSKDPPSTEKWWRCAKHGDTKQP